MRRIALTFILLLIILSTLNTQMLFNDIEKEIYSPYTNGITPDYDMTVDGSHVPLETKNNLSEEAWVEKKEADPLVNIKELANALLPEAKVERDYAEKGELNDKKATHIPKDDVEIFSPVESKKETPSSSVKKTTPKVLTNPLTKPSKKVLSVEIRPSNEIRYPDQNFIPAQPNSKLGFSGKLNVSPKNSFTSEPPRKTRTLPGGGKQWFIVMKVSSSEKGLEIDKEKVKKLFKSVAVNIHEESGYYFLMAGPAGQDSIGIMMKLAKFNGYPEAVTVIAR